MEGMMSATEVSKEHLQQLGREAASFYSDRKGTMTDAVISVLEKEAGLSPEHVKRVVEIANNEAYRDEFDTMDGEHRVVNIDGGPASPGVVLRELEMSDSAPALVKSASRAEAFRAFVPGEEEFDDYFDKEKTAHEEEPLPQSRPNGELIDLRDQLGAARSVLMSKLSSAEIEYDEVAANMYSLVKQAVLTGTSPAEVSTVFQRVSTSPVFTKLALRVISKKMEPEGIPAVVASRAQIKQASERTLNVHHPLVESFLTFSKVAGSRAHLLNGISEIDTQLKRVNRALHEAMR
jgi:hypothetical protein